MKSGNTTSSGGMMNKTGSDNMSKADNANGNMSKAGNTTASNITKVGGGVLSNLSKAVSAAVLRDSVICYQEIKNRKLSLLYAHIATDN